jgi:hypothetical protein
MFKFVVVLLSIAAGYTQGCLLNVLNPNCPEYIRLTSHYAAPTCETLLAHKLPLADFVDYNNNNYTLYSDHELHFNPIMSRYYAARLADAFDYEHLCRCANAAELKALDVMTPWSGAHGAIAVDAAKGYDRSFIRRCKFPTADGATPSWPFLCKGDDGSGGADGDKLGTLSYIPILHDMVDHKWTLFGQCWNPKTPSNPNAQVVATSFNVFNWDSPTLSEEAKSAIIAKLAAIGFDTSPANIIESDYSDPIYTGDGLF